MSPVVCARGTSHADAGPRALRYHGSWLKGTNLWIVMEYCSGGSCSDLVRAGGKRS